MQRLYVAALPLIRADVPRALDLIWGDVYADMPHAFVLVNAYSSTLRREPGYAAVLASDRVVPLVDSMPLSLGARLLGHGRTGRAPGPDVFEAAAERAVADGTSFFLLGGGHGVVEELRDALVARHPGLRIVGTATPPFGDWSEDETSSLIEAVRASEADVVWVGVSAPRQEKWAVANIDRLGRPVVCVGAAFDFLSGRKARAPRWVRTLGMEWAFRLATEPRRLWRRYLVGNIVFVWDLLAPVWRAERQSAE